MTGRVAKATGLAGADAPEPPSRLGPSEGNPRATCDNCNNVRWVCENHPDHPWAGMVDSMVACGCGAGEPCAVCSPGARWAVPLFLALQHGDADHKEWLRDAIEAFFARTAIPVPRGSGNKEKRIAELEAALTYAAETTNDKHTSRKAFEALASAIEARSDATPKNGAAEGESATRQGGRP